MIVPDKSCWIAVIQTDQYAGDFEKQLCAYCTGVAGHFEMADITAECYRLAADFSRSYPDYPNGWRKKLVLIEDGIEEKYSSIRMSGGKNSFAAIYFREKPTEQEWLILRARAYDYFAPHHGIPDYPERTGNPPTEILRFQLIKRTVTVREEVVPME